MKSWIFPVAALFAAVVVGCSASDTASSRQSNDSQGSGGSGAGQGGSSGNGGSGQSNAGGSGQSNTGGSANAGGAGGGGGTGVATGGAGGSGAGGAGGSGGSSAAGGAGGTGGTDVATDNGTLPCNLSNTGYLGDDTCIAPPPDGVQFHFGPNDYGSSSVQPFLASPGTQPTDCVYGKSSNTKDLYFSASHARGRPGMHHLIVYLIPGAPNHQLGVPQACDYSNWQYLIGTQSGAVDFPGGPVAPENEGVAMRLPPNTYYAMELHALNTGSSPMLREAWVNLVYRDPSEVKAVSAPIALYAGMKMNVAAGQTQSLNYTATAPANMRLLDLAGHFHMHTTSLTLKVGGGTVYQATNWQDPGAAFFDSIHTNAQPDQSGMITVNKGQQITWTCVVNNTTSAPLKYGNYIDTAEMCNLFGAYVPTAASGTTPTATWTGSQ